MVVKHFGSFGLSSALLSLMGCYFSVPYVFESLIQNKGHSALKHITGAPASLLSILEGS